LQRPPLGDAPSDPDRRQGEDEHDPGRGHVERLPISPTARRRPDNAIGKALVVRANKVLRGADGMRREGDRIPSKDLLAVGGRQAKASPWEVITRFHADFAREFAKEFLN
jgi:hypothetical protein